MRKGQTWVEYTLILVAIALVAIGSYKSMGGTISSIASGIDAAVTNA